MNVETASPIEWPVPWDIGAPMPFLISSGRTFLIYYASKVLPTYDKTVVKVFGESNEQDLIALVEFLSCYDLKFGGPDEHTFGGSASISGLKPYHAHVVENSSWKEHLMREHAASIEKGEINWSKYKHFVLGFHDERFECIAKSYYIEVYTRNYDDVLRTAFDRASGIGSG